MCVRTHGAAARARAQDDDEDLDEPSAGRGSSPATRKRFSCEIASCRKQFTLKCNLRRHMCACVACEPLHANAHRRKLHNGQQPYECPVCGKRSARKDAISRHLEQHRDSDRSTKMSPITRED